MRSSSKIAAKIVVSVTTLVLFSACGHTGVKPENNFQTPEPIDTSAISPDTESSANFKADETPQLQEPAQLPVQQKVAKKKSKKHYVKVKTKKSKAAAQAKSAPTETPAAAAVTPATAAASTSDVQMESQPAIDPNQLPLSVGSVETPAPPALPPIYEGANESNNALIAAVGAIALIVGGALVIRRRRTRSIVFNA